MSDDIRPGCCVCARPLPTGRYRTCLPCIADTRHHLEQIIDAAAMLATTALYGTPSGDGTGRSSGEVHTLPGGNSLALLGPSALAGEWRDEDGMTPLDILGTWQRLWQEEWAHPADTTATLSGVVAWLHARCEYAAEGLDDYRTFARAVAKLAVFLTRQAGTDAQVDRGGPCLECGQRLERQYGEVEARDWWRCPGCHRSYDITTYRLVALAEASRRKDVVTDPRKAETEARRLHDADDAALVTRLDLAHHLPNLPATTVRQWASRRRLATYGSDDKGRTLYRLGDVRKLATQERQAG